MRRGSLQLDRNGLLVFLGLVQGFSLMIEENEVVSFADLD